MSPAPIVKGWCPGAYAPMESGDGLLLRAKLIGPRLALRQARATAEIAQDCGNGLIDLSQRAQLQLRGLSAATLAPALRRLAEAGLLAENPEAERVQNLLASPLPAADAIDAKALARAIYEDEALRALPPKFLFLIDDGAPRLDDADADIRLERVDASRVALRLGAERVIAALVARDAAIPAALALARAFVTLRHGAEQRLRRMRALVDDIGAAAIFAAAGLATTTLASPAPTTPRIFGAHALGGSFFAGVGAPFGRWRAEALHAFVEAAEHCGASELRVTPWRALLALTPDRDAATRLARDARALGLIADDDDARLAVVACPGAPECSQALGATHEIALALAPLARTLAPQGPALHVSGCAKGCAHPGALPATLIARAQGYDLVFDGAASGAPTATALSPQEIATALRRRAKEETPCPAH
jgi:precorrin-3B synthase